VNSALVFLINNLHFMSFLLAFPSQILQEIIHVECIYNLYMQNACIVISLYIINLVSTVLFFLLTKSNIMSAGFVFCCFGCQKTHFVKIWWHGLSSIFLLSVYSQNVVFWLIRFSLSSFVSKKNNYLILHGLYICIPFLNFPENHSCGMYLQSLL